MKSLIIRINKLSDLYEFSKRAALVEGDVLLSRGKYTVDAKSMMGIFTINLSEPTMLQFPEDAEDFYTYATTFATH